MSPPDCLTHSQQRWLTPGSGNFSFVALSRTGSGKLLTQCASFPLLLEHTTTHLAAWNKSHYHTQLCMPWGWQVWLGALLRVSLDKH